MMFLMNFRKIGNELDALLVKNSPITIDKIKYIFEVLAIPRFRRLCPSGYSPK
jgi:hypothetical protein